MLQQLVASNGKCQLASDISRLCLNRWAVTSLRTALRLSQLLNVAEQPRRAAGGDDALLTHSVFHRFFLETISICNIITWICNIITLVLFPADNGLSREQSSALDVLAGNEDDAKLIEGD